MPRISVIVPARDVADYVGALLDDLRLQTFPDIEVIVVDDGSGDRSPEIVASIAGRDGRFRHTSSGGAGVSVARNLGIREATGEFLAFVDADDRVSPDYLRVMLEAAVATGSDLVSCNANRLDGFRASPAYLQQRACGSTRRRTHISRTPQLVWDTTVWNKLWRRTMWDAAEIRFAEGRWINDIVPSIHGHVASRQVDTVSDVLYFWRVRTDPATSITDRKLTDPTARLKSFHDRIYALRRARELLCAAIPKSAALTAFDQRILELDLPMYLPYYESADEGYRAAVAQQIRQLLETFHIDPARFPLGMVLQEAYRSLLAGDLTGFATALDPTTHVAPSPRRRQHTEFRLPSSAPDPGHAPATTAHGLVRWGASRALRQLGGRGTVPPAVRAEATAISVTFDPGGELTVSGAVRVREGRSYLPHGWRVAARLDGTSRMQDGLTRLLGRRSDDLLRERLPTARRLTGPATPVGDPPDRALHPLIRSGWVPFTATIDLRATRRHPRVDRWRLMMELRGGRMTLTARVTLPDEIAGSLPASVRIDPAVELIPETGPVGNLSFCATSPLEETAAPRQPPADLDLRWLAAADQTGLLRVGGSGDPVAGTTLALHCPWTRTTLTFPVEPDPAGWQALVDTTAMDRRLAAQGQRWSMSIVTGDSSPAALRVPPALRGRVATPVSLGPHPAFLLLDRDRAATLAMAAPDPGADLWPQLVRVERSTPG